MKRLIKIKECGSEEKGIILKEVTDLKCDLENVVYLKNENPLYPEEKYISYDYKTGLAIAKAKTIKDLSEKVNELKEKVLKIRNSKEYEKWVLNEQLF